MLAISNPNPLSLPTDLQTTLKNSPVAFSFMTQVPSWIIGARDWVSRDLKGTISFQAKPCVDPQKNYFKKLEKWFVEGLDPEYWQYAYRPNWSRFQARQTAIGPQDAEPETSLPAEEPDASARADAPPLAAALEQEQQSIDGAQLEQTQKQFSFLEPSNVAKKASDFAETFKRAIEKYGFERTMEKLNESIMLAQKEFNDQPLKLLCYKALMKWATSYAANHLLSHTIPSISSIGYPEKLVLGGKILIFSAAEVGNLDVLEKIRVFNVQQFRSGGYQFSLDHTNLQGRAIAHIAAFNGYMHILKWMAREPLLQAFLQNRSRGNYYNIAHIAALSGQIAVIQWLLSTRQMNLLTGFVLENEKEPEDTMKNMAQIAARHGQLKLLQWMHDNPTLQGQLHSFNEHYYNIAHFAALGQHVGILDWLLNSHNKKLMASLSGKTSADSNIAHLAAKIGSIPVLEWIFAHRPDLCKAVETFSRQRVPHIATKGGHLPVLKWLLSINHLDYLTATNGYQMNIAHTAARAGNLDILNWLQSQIELLHLLEATTPDEDILYPLSNIAHIAVEENHLEVIQWIAVQESLQDLLTEPSRRGNNIAHRATRRPGLKVIQWISKNSNLKHLLHQTNDAGQTPLDLLATPEIDQMNIAHRAAEAGDLTTLEWIQSQASLQHLLEITTPPNENLFARYPISNIAHIAADTSRFDILAWIANQERLQSLLTQPSHSGDNIAHLAVSSFSFVSPENNESRLQIIKWIAQNPNLQHLLNQPNDAGKTPLDKANPETKSHIKYWISNA